MQERDEERERLRRELQRSQDQIHAFLSTSQSQVSGLIPRPPRPGPHLNFTYLSSVQVSSTAQAGTGTSSNVSATSPASRPASFISVEESSGAELSEERNHESEDDGESVRQRESADERSL